MPINVIEIDPAVAERTEIVNATTYDARKVIIDGDELIVMIYGSGPSDHIHRIARMIDAMIFISIAPNGDVSVKQRTVTVSR